MLRGFPKRLRYDDSQILFSGGRVLECLISLQVSKQLGVNIYYTSLSTRTVV